MHRKFVIALLALVAIVLGCARVEVLPGPDPDCPTPSPIPAEEPPPPPGPESVYGSRLAPMWRTFDDGTRVLDAGRLWDSERGEACSFVRVEDGPARCLPAFVWNSKPGSFADAGCSKPVVVVDNCAELPRYVRDESAKPWDVCAPYPLDVLHVLGEPLAQSALFKVNPLGTCVQDSVIDVKNVAMPIGEAVPLDAFVGGEEGP